MPGFGRDAPSRSVIAANASSSPSIVPDDAPVAHRALDIGEPHGPLVEHDAGLIAHVDDGARVLGRVDHRVDLEFAAGGVREPTA